MSNKLINDFENFLQRNDMRKALSVIGVTRLEDNDDITLLLKDERDGIGGHFTVYPFEPQRYDIGDFVEFMDWCFKQGWIVRLELSDYFDFKENRRVGRFAVEAQERKD
ncbi:MAG: hypothetical protein K2J80_12520 [Oscillospiraceae bacterium]|nr:hypothetical protein [Oscillospiraceae bacterium]